MSYIAIDTNIFEHLLNREAMNSDSHNDQLLGRLRTLGTQLLVDSTRKIGGEYETIIIPMIRNMDETRQQLPLLRFWMQPEVRHQVDLNPQDNLMQQIKRVIHERDEHADRAFVYVACARDSVLVTNDGQHILDRRADLLKKTKNSRGRNTDILSSKDAHRHFRDNGAPA